MTTGKFLKCGSSSIVLGSGHYGRFIPYKSNKLIKLSHKNKHQDEMKLSSIVKSIKEYNKYYCLPDNEKYSIEDKHNLYIYLNIILEREYIHLLQKELDCYYVDYAGNVELLDTINDITNYSDFTIWSSYKAIIKFAKHIMKGLMYLHQKQICHLDIKPENIVVNTLKKEFRIIDFGFASKEPFDDFVYNIRGTPGYFPKIFKGEVPSEWFPLVQANDVIKVNGKIPIVEDRSLVYKIDSYCFGRLLHLIRYEYDYCVTYICCNKDKRLSPKLTAIIRELTKNDVYERMTITDCLETFIL